ncbi:MAG: DCC1-like thiol-disulfide oxidoreductase family protein [Gemmatales bacterium]|nr:DCC1-like thiol-disulfide oxidoreductase family protein [Gemmatales bacterium]MDW8386679.1 DCC1-like thiol-disulfide oxidoreductase family protein [Gemmatales bacterium]
MNTATMPPETDGRCLSSPSAAASDVEQPIIFFDGVCGLCNRFVDTMLRADKDGIFRFAPLQGETAKALLPPLGEDAGAWSVVYRDSQGTYRESEAVLRAMKRLGGWWGMLAVLRIVPRPVRDGIYRLIARNRYRWFGKRTSCRLPTPEERARFLP